MPSRPARVSARGDRGFTVIESLTAAVILLLVATGIITVLITTSGWYAQARMRTEATAVANQVMALVLSRNYTDIKYSEDATLATPPALLAIHKTMTWPSAIGLLSVRTDIDDSLVASSTGLPIKQVTVTATPLNQIVGRPVAISIVRLATDTPNTLASTASTVTVQVQIKEKSAGGTLENLKESGVRVQLLYSSASPDPEWATVYTAAGHSPTGLWALTDPNGIATFESVPQVKDPVNPGYFLTADPRFGTAIRPLHFPERVYPTRMGGSTPVVKYSLEVVRHDTPAILSIGAFQTQGFYSSTLVFGRYNWLIEKPYRPAVGASGTRLRIYAMPILNTVEIEGRTTGTASIYPSTEKLGPYSAEVNDYGIARIVIPWTIDAGLGQSWLVWCRTVGHTAPPYTMTIRASGGWDVPIDQAELMDQPLASSVAQFTDIGSAEPVNLPERP